MILHYELTLEDFREAQVNHSSAPRRGRPRRWLLYAITFVMFYLMLSFVVPGLIAAAASGGAGAAGSGGVGGGGGAVWLHFCIPFLVVGIMIFAIAGVATIRNRGKMGAGMRPRGAIAWAMVVVLGAVLFLVVHGGARRGGMGGAGIPDRGLDWASILMPHLGWLALMVFLTFFIVRSQIAGVQRAWERQTHIQGPMICEVTGEGIAITAPAARHEYRWTAITRYLETPNVYLLYISEAAFQIFPKRGFGSEEEREGFSNMAKNLVGKKAAGFEVVTPAPGV